MPVKYSNTSTGQSGGLSETVIAEVESIDFSSTGNTALLTVPVGQSVVVTKAFVFIDNAVGLTGTMASGIGFNGAADNIISSSNMTGFNDTAQQFYVMLVNHVTYNASAGDIISFGIDAAFGGVVSGSVVLFGIIVNE